MTEYTLLPEDLPLELYSKLEADLAQQAFAQVDSARACLAAGDTSGAVARYEGALARLLLVRRLAETNLQAASTVSRAHGERLALVAIAADPNADVDEPSRWQPGYVEGSR